jgi:hypothetical protein
MHRCISPVGSSPVNMAEVMSHVNGNRASFLYSDMPNTAQAGRYINQDEGWFARFSISTWRLISFNPG